MEAHAWTGVDWLINIAYFIVAVLFILGLKAMSSPKTARTGILWAGVTAAGMPTGGLMMADALVLHPRAVLGAWLKDVDVLSAEVRRLVRGDGCGA